MRRTVLLSSALAFFLALAWLHPRGLSWDELAFLMGAEARTIDLGHALYLPALRGTARLCSPSLSPEQAARLFSAAGAALAFVLLARRAERAGASSGCALLVAALFSTGTLFWRESGSVEPTSWTIAGLLLAAELAEAYSRDRSAQLGALFGLGFGLSLGFHLVSLCALPWLLALALGARGRPPLAHLLLLCGVALCVLLLGAVLGDLPAAWRYWSGFVPTYDAGLASELGRHTRRAVPLLCEGAPVLVVLGLVCALALARRRPRAVATAGALAAPYALAFLVLGKPLVGLLLPVLLACALLVGEAAGAARVQVRLGTALLALALAVQLALSLPEALEWRRAPDRDRERAALLVRHLPEDAVLFAGRLANHVRYFHPGAPLVSLPELWHEAFARDRAADPIDVVQRAVAGAGRRCLLSLDGVAFLQSIPADPLRLGIEEGAALLVPGDPLPLLFPLDRE